MVRGETTDSDVERFDYVGLDCKVVRMDQGHWCGYVRRPEEVEPVRWTSDYDSKHNEIIDAEVEVWGGITYGPDEDGWVGFDDAHSRKLADHREQTSDKSAVKEEVQHLAEQIVELQGGGMNRPRPTETVGEYFGAIYRTGNHASIEGFVPPSENGIIRLVHADTDRTDQ